MTGTTMLLDIRDLTIAYREKASLRTLVRGVSFTLSAGETVAVIGESGSGKSIISRAIIGLLPPNVTMSGSIRLNGLELVGRPDRTMRGIRGNDIVLLLQDPFTMLNPLQTVRQHIAESLRSPLTAKDGSNSILSLLREVGIQDSLVAERYPWELSGGMRQRVGLAAALARRPSILIADEPTTALDASTQLEILDLLARVQRSRDLSLIFVTHNLSVARSISDRLLVMYAGGLLEDQPISSPHAPAHPYTLGLTLAAPPADKVRQKLVAIPGSVPRADEVVGCCAFVARCQWAAAQCQSGQPPICEVSPGHRSACVRFEEIEGEMRSKEMEFDVEAVRIPPRPVRPKLLDVADLRLSYGATRQVHVALKGISLFVREGESVAVVGESGSGKTSLARCILGLNTPDSGRITIAAHDATDYSRLSRAACAHVRTIVQCIFQDPYSSLNPAFRVSTIVKEALSMAGQGTSDEHVRALLERVGLPEGYRDRKPAALSGGERQRVAIARALATNPRLLICDEPVSALDVSVQAQILELLRKVQREESTALLFITHDLAVARQIAHRVVVLYRGEIVEDAPTETLFSSPSHQHTRRLLEAAVLGRIKKT